MRRLAFPLLIVATLLVCPQGQAQAPAADPAPTVLSESFKAFGLTTLEKALDDTGLRKQLAGKGPLTLFAPSNAAFKMLGRKRSAALVADPKELKIVLLNHIVKGKYTTGDLGKLPHLGKLKTLGGGELVVFNKGALLVNMSKPYQADKKATNGIMHIMDRVLMPKK
jgi:uncharacterized surface protein with fasciclin (FAS1) repeats